MDYMIPSKNVIMGVYLLSWWNVPNMIFKKDHQIKYSYVRQEKYTYTKLLKNWKMLIFIPERAIISFSLFIEYMSLLK